MNNIVGDEQEVPVELRIVDKALIKEFQCGICLQILSEPRQCRNGHLYCLECIKTYSRRTTQEVTCPQCRCPFSESNLSRNLFVEKHLKSCKVRCKWHFANVQNRWKEDETGCPEILVLETSNIHESTCDYTFVSCRYSTICGKLRARDLAVHSATCPYQPAECMYCRLSVQKIKLEEHVAKCPQAILECVAGCGVELRRHELHSHLEKECPDYLVPCEFCDMGCTEKLKRTQMKEHLEIDPVRHLSLFKKAFDLHRAELKETIQQEIQRRDTTIARLDALVKSNYTRLVWNIPNWTTATRKPYIQSNKFTLAGFTWFMGCYTDGDNAESRNFLSIYLFLDVSPPVPKGKSVTLDYCIKFINHKNPKKSVLKDFKTKFPIKGFGQGWGERKSIPTREITEESGFLKNGTLFIEAEITVKEVTWRV